MKLQVIAGTPAFPQDFDQLLGAEGHCLLLQQANSMAELKVHNVFYLWRCAHL
jgi:hypothetical protein